MRVSCLGTCAQPSCLELRRARSLNNSASSLRSVTHNFATTADTSPAHSRSCTLSSRIVSCTRRVQSHCVRFSVQNEVRRRAYWNSASSYTGGTSLALARVPKYVAKALGGSGGGKGAAAAVAGFTGDNAGFTGDNGGITADIARRVSNLYTSSTGIGVSGLEPTQLPRHIAVIMDGNARWAAKKGLPAVAGYERGVESLRGLVRCCCEWEISALTVFAFSQDNWSRAKEEVSLLLGLMGTVLRNELPGLNKAGVRLHFIGNLSMLPSALQADLSRAMELTAHNSKLELCIAISYSSRGDMTSAVAAVAAAAAKGLVRPEDVTADLISEYLSTGNVLPKELKDPDLLIRTSGEQRLSDFLLWEMAYTELYFTDVNWPDFGADELRRSLQSYARRTRRYGTH
mmetsp:Transcript_36560/g.61611  ORF Transcript_36560/g.61611 Transcript_36560/m.61611 type:complete len:401 (+) Transcript_36560:533-1735(+)